MTKKNDIILIKSQRTTKKKTILKFHVFIEQIRLFLFPIDSRQRHAPIQREKNQGGYAIDPPFNPIVAQQTLSPQGVSCFRVLFIREVKLIYQLEIESFFIRKGFLLIFHGFFLLRKVEKFIVVDFFKDLGG